MVAISRGDGGSTTYLYHVVYSYSSDAGCTIESIPVQMPWEISDEVDVDQIAKHIRDLKGIPDPTIINWILLRTE